MRLATYLPPCSIAALTRSVFITLYLLNIARGLPAADFHYHVFRYASVY